MKVLLINGSPNEKGCTYTALAEIAVTLEKEGIEWEIFWIGKKPIAGCIACRYCKTNKKCVFEDGVNTLLARKDEFDAIIVGSPVYYGGPAGQLTAFLDRMFYAGRGFAGKLGAAVVSCRRGGATASFDRLNKYFTINSMPIVSSQYWNMVHGFTPEDVKKDGEGLQTMCTLAWLLRCIEAGKREGIAFPEQEPRISTNFIN